MEKNSNNKKNDFKKNDDDFDWARIIRMVFGWGAVIVAAVIVMQMLKTSGTTYTEIKYDRYQSLLEKGQIYGAKITKSDLNDYNFQGDLREPNCNR